MDSFAEIKKAIAGLSVREKALLSAELFASAEPDSSELQEALEKGMKDLQDGRTRPAEAVEGLIDQWIAKS